jgi:hypothetical protein
MLAQYAGVDWPTGEDHPGFEHAVQPFAQGRARAPLWSQSIEPNLADSGRRRPAAGCTGTGFAGGAQGQGDGAVAMSTPDPRGRPAAYREAAPDPHRHRSLGRCALLGPTLPGVWPRGEAPGPAIRQAVREVE